MSELRKLVKETYVDQIKNGDYPPDLKKFLFTHERKLLFFDNLIREFSNPKFAKATRETVIRMTREMTNFFVLSAKRRADELNMSAIERGLIKAKGDRVKEMRKLGDAMDALESTNVTQDKAGNETTKSEIVFDERFV